MSTIAFIGLGIMGGPMSRHLVEAGHSVIGFDRSPGPMERVVGGQTPVRVARAAPKAGYLAASYHFPAGT